MSLAAEIGPVPTEPLTPAGPIATTDYLLAVAVALV